MSKTPTNDFNEAEYLETDVLHVYNSHLPEQELLVKLSDLRRLAGLTQMEVAEKLNTHKSAISRLESGGGKEKHSPSLSTIRAYADAINCEFRIVFVSKTKDNEETAKTESAIS